ncbi:VQ domain-containing protein [Psidium guajava]|nr:VQ domain-containing protein [Psidium guajava]
MERYSSAAAMVPQEEAATVPPQAYPFHKSLHSVRKAPAKPWKKPTASLPPNPTRVYKVEPINFRELVQKLTGAPSRRPPPPPARRLQEAAPPPLELVTPSPARSDINNNSHSAAAKATTPLSTVYRELVSEGLEKKPAHKFGDGFELSLSPSFLGWSTIPMLSPGTLSGF